MKIKTQFILSMAIFGVLLLVIAASAIVTNQQVDRLNKQEEVAKNIERAASELGLLSNDYFLYHESQQRARWEAKFSELSDDLSNLNPNSPEQQALVSNIRANQERLRAVFTDVVSSFENNTATDTAFQTSWSRMAIQNQGMAFDAERLAQTSRDQAHHLEQINITLIFVLLGIFGAYFLTNYLIVYRRALKSISYLQAGTRIIGSGNLDYSIETNRQDEIGELSSAFNKMTADLKGVTASKAELEREITERRRTEEALRASEEQFRRAIEDAPIPVIMHTEDGEVLQISRTWTELTGYTLQDVPTLDAWLNKAYGEGADKVRDHVRELFGGSQRSIDIEFSIHTRYGKLRHWSFSASSPGILQDGRRFIVGMAVDITERRRAEEALRKAHDELEMRVQERTAELAHANEGVKAERQRFNDILNMLPAYLVLLSRDYHVPFANRFFRERFGESHGLRCFEYLFNRCEPCEICETYSVLKTNSPHHWEWTGPDGRNYDIFDYPFTDIDGSTLIMEVGIDITERKRGEEQIREQAELLDKAQDAIGIRDLEHRIIYLNKSAQRLYGWTMEEVAGKNADELFYKEKSPPMEAKKSVIEKGEWVGELRQQTRDLKEIIVESRWTLVRDSGGKPKSILIINTDITEKKKLESQLMRAQRMESIGTLASGMAHDLNNVLTPIMLSLQMLKGKFKDEQSQKLLSTLEQSSKRGASLIKQVLTFARGIEGERNPIQIKHIISEIEKIAKETFPRNIGIRTDIQKDLFTISGDATQLHQVVMNLCVNARDAMPQGGTLSITASNFIIDKNYVKISPEAKAGPYILVEVSDTGTGIPPEILDRIFEPFFTTKEHGKGTGLGLPTSLAIVKSHGGFINVYSEVGRGTVFKVYLPAVKSEVLEAEALQFELPSGEGEYILVADDEDPIREITISILEAYGYKALSASDGKQAVASYAQNKDKIKVVLMDMMMPVMDGYASILAIHKISSEAKIIAVSGLAEKDKLAKIADARVQAFLPKPYTAEILLKTIQEVLSGKK